MEHRQARRRKPLFILILAAWGFAAPSAGARVWVDRSELAQARAITRTLSRATFCRTLEIFRGEPLACAEPEPTDPAGPFVADVLHLGFGPREAPLAPARRSGLDAQLRCQWTIGGSVRRYVGAKLVLRAFGVPRDRADAWARSSLRGIGTHCAVTVGESAAGIRLPRVGPQCAGAVGDVGAPVDPDRLERCLAILLARWVDLARGDAEPLRPNILLIMTDDQRWDMVDGTHSPDGMDVMPILGSELAASGIEFANAFATTPLCCPSRASILTGQYAHTHGVLRNSGDFGGAPAFDDSSTLATRLQDAGYRTGLFGKYLNGYANLWDRDTEPPYVPPGWDTWYAFVAGEGTPDPGFEEDGEFFNYELVENDRIVAHGDDEAAYSTDYLRDRALEHIRSAAQAGEPFFASLNLMAGHKPWVPAPRHEGTFAELRWGTLPSYNEADVSDKPAWVRSLPLLQPVETEALQREIRSSFETLLAVDEAIGVLLSELRDLGIADDTIVIFISDHGHAFGEHRWTKKGCPYEECIRIPMIVRYPALAPEGRRDENFALTIDLAPTLTELAGATPPPAPDGRSLVGVLDGRQPTLRTQFLIESYAPTRVFAGIRESRWKYVEYAHGESELYDLVEDPYELENLTGSPAHAEQIMALRARLLAQRPLWPSDVPF